jgi:hypothetical protein
MLTSSWPMKAPIETVPTTYQWARGLARTPAGRRGSVSSKRRSDATGGSSSGFTNYI